MLDMVLEHMRYAIEQIQRKKSRRSRHDKNMFQQCMVDRHDIWCMLEQSRNEVQIHECLPNLIRFTIWQKEREHNGALNHSVIGFTA